MRPAGPLVCSVGGCTASNQISCNELCHVFKFRVFSGLCEPLGGCVCVCVCVCVYVRKTKNNSVDVELVAAHMCGWWDWGVCEQMFLEHLRFSREGQKFTFYHFVQLEKNRLQFPQINKKSEIKSRYMNNNINIIIKNNKK